MIRIATKVKGSQIGRVLGAAATAAKADAFAKQMRPIFDCWPVGLCRCS